MILITGASGQLGRLVIDNLLNTTPANQIVAAVRNPEKIADLAEKGVQIRQADYSDLDSLVAAMQGVEKVLLVSSSEVGQRVEQHRNVIHAAKEAGVALIAYTSILNADTSPLILAKEHVATENLLAESGVPYVLLRNGWYSENYTMGLATALEYGVVGCAEDGKLSTAARADYAAAAAAVLVKDGQAGKVYELVGDNAFTLSEYAAAISKVSGKTVTYHNVPEAEYTKILVGAGLPEGFAAVLADSEVGASQGGLFSDSKDLSTLIGRPTTSIEDSIKAAL
ncbi:MULTISPECIES: SDR family oxidoreductase [Marinomonas]|uniref:SDR family oxidoreductase n=1 Tax=Marinomonas arctica TaxID=383750 RepID=A0A7H1J6H5_9GAMM|nr:MULTISPECIES: SDR family oxidoreductase [Marinomonas]MCS7485074.1 quinone oxidoreductase [Marinomonas sp. BSi20414]QNT06091.1 SDR family oxidoreductase [Marinomonas arctica]GGN18999.1 NAD(P)-dependent oxidoreductase [Marinomonas arctica]